MEKCWRFLFWVLLPNVLVLQSWGHTAPSADLAMQLLAAGLPYSALSHTRVSSVLPPRMFSHLSCTNARAAEGQRDIPVLSVSFLVLWKMSVLVLVCVCVCACAYVCVFLCILYLVFISEHSLYLFCFCLFCFFKKRGSVVYIAIPCMIHCSRFSSSEGLALHHLHHCCNCIHISNVNKGRTFGPCASVTASLRVSGGCDCRMCESRQWPEPACWEEQTLGS